tara:strand:- start:1522 stop:2574 length:1053 start_codon:yes stop_codon:yes gene_type:complete
MTNNFNIRKPYLIAGPCSAESEEQVINIAREIQDIADVFRAGIWKPRTHPNSFEGVGEKGLKWLQRIKKETSLKVATEVATPKHVEACLKLEIDILWIGARTTVNPFYIQEIASALRGTNMPVFVKNPIHPDLGLWLGAFERLNKSGINDLSAIHRGFYSSQKSAFRNDPKWEMVIKLRKERQDIPIICDPSHIAGDATLIEDISQMAMDINLDGLMIETHDAPSSAMSDNKQQITPLVFKKIIKGLILRDPELDDKIFMIELKNLRNKIDYFDSDIIELLKNRKDIVEEIGLFKKKNKLTIFQLERLYEILETRTSRASKLGLDTEMIEEIFELIHKYSILNQTRIMTK